MKIHVCVSACLGWTSQCEQNRVLPQRGHYGSVLLPLLWKTGTGEQRNSDVISNAQYESRQTDISMSS